MKRSMNLNMTCKECKHFQPTTIMEVDIKPYIGKGYTLQEILKISALKRGI